MSMLGGVTGIRGAVFNVGLAITGLLLVVLSEVFTKTRNSAIGLVLIALGGFALIGSAVFPCSPGCVNILQELTPIGTWYIITSFLYGFCLAISPLASYLAMRKDHHWSNPAGFTLVMGIMANIPGEIFWASFAFTRLTSWEGML
jgi:hypothetical membrane protein